MLDTTASQLLPRQSFGVKMMHLRTNLASPSSSYSSNAGETHRSIDRHCSSAGSWEGLEKWGPDSDSWFSAEDWKVRKDTGVGGSRSAQRALSLSPIIGRSCNVDKVLYQSLVEMIPLVESFMDQQWNQSKSFPLHASPVYTPAPSRDWTPKKVAESPGRGMMARQLFGNTPGEVKDSVLRVGNEDSQCHNDRQVHPEEIEVVAFPSDQAPEHFVSNVEVFKLQSQIEQLEQKLHEKEIQLQTAEENAKQVNLQLTLKAEELQRDLWHKEQQIHDACAQLCGKQREITNIQSLVEKAEADAVESGRKAAGIEEELNRLRFQVAALLFQLENTEVDTAYDRSQAMDLHENSATRAILSEGQMEEKPSISKLDEMKVECMESVRQKYLAAIIAAGENQGEELLPLAAALRSQLQGFLLQPAFASLSNDLHCSQVSRHLLC